MGEPIGWKYKYLGILDRDDILNKDMNDEDGFEILRECAKCYNCVNIWPFAFVRYSAPILKWTKNI